MRRVERAGLLCLAAALGGFVAIPALHLIGHHDDHIHVDGAIVYQHHHDDEDDHDHHDHDQPDLDHPDHDHHGDGGLAHFRAATLGAEAAIDPLPVFTVEDAVVARELASTRSVLAPHRARAPPSA